MDDAISAAREVSLDQLAERAAQLAELVNAASRAAESDAGLTSADASVLLALQAAPDYQLKPTALSSRCGLSSGGTSNVLLRLTRAGYTTREANVQDGRSTWAHLTQEGEALIRSLRGTTAAEHQKLLDRLPKGTVSDLNELLGVVLRHLEQDHPSTLPLPQRCRHADE